MALDYSYNFTCLVEKCTDNQQIMHSIFVFFLTLFIISIHVQLNIVWKWTVFHRHLYFAHSIFQNTFQAILRIYDLVWECRKIQAIQEKVSQWRLQVLPPPDKFIAIPDLPRFTLQQKYSLQPTEVKLQNSPAHEQDWASTRADPQRDYWPLTLALIDEHIQTTWHKHTLRYNR